MRKAERMQIGIVADDLTGAADAIAPFAQCGLNADIAYVVRGKLRCDPAESDARAWDTETRELPPERSFAISRLTRTATRRLKAFDPWLYYKKIDSTLRGHLRLELDAMRRELPFRLSVVCPAFPANGRTVENGILTVYGTPLLAPGRRTVREAFQATQDDPVGELPLAFIRQGVESVHQTFLHMADQGLETVFCDAVLQTDLEILAQAILRHPSRYLPVGSAGLASALAAQPSSPRPPPPKAWEEGPGIGAHVATGEAERREVAAGGNASEGIGAPSIFTTGRILVAVGSRNPVSRKQTAYLAARAGIRPIVLESERNFRYEVITGAVAQLQAQWNSGQRIGLLLTPETAAGQNVALYLMSSALYLYKNACSHPIDGLIVTGGETAVQFLTGFDAIGMRIAGQLQPGIVHGSLVSANGSDKRWCDGLPMITKAGGFGTEETLARCVGLR
jgi:uncharacterized protein YgbK (DUF1537 family)